MVYDCFNFFNELDILKIRLNELEDVVDKFVLVEGTVTFSGKKKDLYYSKNKSLFQKFNHKIIHIIVRDNPATQNPWEIEQFQFNAIKRGLKGLKDTDTVLLSNVDEIPRANKINEYKGTQNKNTAFNQVLSYYYLNLVANRKWKGTRMFSYKNLKTIDDIYSLRHSKEDLIINDGGWHFSYLGGVEQIQKKINAYSHQEYNNPEYTSLKHITESI